MTSSMQTVVQMLQHSNLPALALATAVASFVVLAVAGGVCFCWRRSSAAARHLIWLLSVASLLLLPLSLAVLPAWQRPLWSVSADLVSGNQVALALELAPGTPASSPANPATISTTAVNDARPARANPINARQLAARFDASWLMAAGVGWMVVTLFALVALLAAQWRVRQFARQSQELRDPDWTALLQDHREKLRIHRNVTLLQSNDGVMPMTWGTWRPMVLLPEESSQWSPERRRVVLQHELAHVKRWDCGTQLITGLACALYWFNPLVWLAARRMRIERELACDDMVLNVGCKASDYAGHLVEIAMSFRPVPQAAAIGMARTSQLEERVAAIVDASRARGLRPWTAAIAVTLLGTLLFEVGGLKSQAASGTNEISKALRAQQLAQIEAFSKAKEKQSEALAAKAGEKISPRFQAYFNAAIKGDYKTVTNEFEYFKKHHPQYEKKPGQATEENLRTSYWSPVLEICLAYEHFATCEPKYTQVAVEGMVNSIPAGSIYFGGTDPGRGLPTAFCKSHADGDPFFTLTQNALADGTYLDYLHAMYGGKIYTPTKEDSQQCYADYLADAKQRKLENKLKPGENVEIKDGNPQVSGQVAVMSINALLTKVVFDHETNREFYVEESFPMDWMYPYLEPHALIMKLNREPLAEMSEATVQADHDYWSKCVDGMIGGWLKDDTSASAVADFAERVYGRKDLGGFTGDRLFLQNTCSQKLFSKLRSSIAAVYAWRAKNSTHDAEKARMVQAADFAFRQAIALCPYSPEAVFRYVTFLVDQNRKASALAIVESAAHLAPTFGDNGSALNDLAENLRKAQTAR